MRCYVLNLMGVALAAGPSLADDWQYKSGAIAVRAATADEAVAAFGPASVRAAAKYLDDGAVAWVREGSCIACHTTGVYMSERVQLSALLGPPQEEVRANFVAEVPDPPAAPGNNLPYGYEAIWRSLGLATWDKHVTGELSEPTSRSLQDMLARQTPKGYWAAGGKVEVPYTTTAFERTVQAARAMATAPGWLAGLSDPEQLRRVERAKAALRGHQPRNDYERVLQLQLAVVMPELVPQATRDAAVAVLDRHQQADGGWSTRSMSPIADWGPILPNNVAYLEREPDADHPASDAYMTSFAIILLRESGVPKEDERVRRGLAWLTATQRASGRWWMKSLYKDTKHYTTYIATAHALRALALCDELPVLAERR
jgi:squalene-hopene/tetraprenyl-beta-curcumene cyclase